MGDDLEGTLDRITKQWSYLIFGKTHDDGDDDDWQQLTASDANRVLGTGAFTRAITGTAKKTTRNLQVINELALKSVIYTPIIANPPHTVFTFPQAVPSRTTWRRPLWSDNLIAKRFRAPEGGFLPRS